LYAHDSELSKKAQDHVQSIVNRLEWKMESICYE